MSPGLPNKFHTRVTSLRQIKRCVPFAWEAGRPGLLPDVPLSPTWHGTKDRVGKAWIWDQADTVQIWLTLADPLVSPNFPLCLFPHPQNVLNGNISLLVLDGRGLSSQGQGCGH